MAHEGTSQTRIWLSAQFTRWKGIARRTAIGNSATTEGRTLTLPHATRELLQSRLDAAALREARQSAVRLGVFSDNRMRPVHRWYPFIEGYSAELVTRALRST